MSIGSAAFDRLNGRDAHDGVADPVPASNQNPERFQGHIFRHKNAALVALKKKIGERSFPAIMDPEPIFRRAPHLLLDDFVDASGERFNRVRLAVDWRLDDRAPACKSGSVHSHRPDLRICSSGQQSGQRCRRC